MPRTSNCTETESRLLVAWLGGWDGGMPVMQGSFLRDTNILRLIVMMFAHLCLY